MGGDGGGVLALSTCCSCEGNLVIRWQRVVVEYNSQFRNSCGVARQTSVFTGWVFADGEAEKDSQARRPRYVRPCAREQLWARKLRATNLAQRGNNDTNWLIGHLHCRSILTTGNVLATLFRHS